MIILRAELGLLRNRLKVVTVSVMKDHDQGRRVSLPPPSGSRSRQFRPPAAGVRIRRPDAGTAASWRARADARTGARQPLLADITQRASHVPTQENLLLRGAYAKTWRPDFTNLIPNATIDGPISRTTCGPGPAPGAITVRNTACAPGLPTTDLSSNTTDQGGLFSAGIFRRISTSSAMS